MTKTTFLIILTVSFLVSFLVDTTYYSEIVPIFLLSISLIVVLSFIFYKENNIAISRVYFRPIHLFLLSFIVVCFQTPIDILLGYQSSYYMVGKVSLMPEAVRVSLLGLIAFFMGYIINKSKVNKPKLVVISRITSTTIYKILTSILLVAIIAFIPHNVLLGGYHTAELSDTVFGYLSSWCMLFCGAFFIQYIINMRVNNVGRNWRILQLIKDIGWWQNINILAFVIVILNVGDRGPMLYLFTAYYIVYLSVTGVCPSKKTILTGLTVGVLFAAFLGYSKKFRNQNTIFERINTTWVSNPYDDLEKSIVPATHELATSYRCLTYSIDDIQKTKNYGYGKYQLRYILSCIPFANSLFELSESSARHITYLIQGQDSTYGNGSTVIADFYLEGGLLAVIIGMFVFGYCTRIFELILFSNKDVPLLLYCIAFFFSMYCIYIPRSVILTNLKGSLWIAIMIYIFQKTNGKVVKKYRHDKL